MNPPYTPLVSSRLKKSKGETVKPLQDDSEQCSRDIKRDLLTLGIDLDESLIERMQRNLGISSTFTSVAKASAIVQERKKLDEVHDIAFRHVQSPQQDELPTPTKAAIAQFQVLISIIYQFGIINFVDRRRARKRLLPYFVVGKADTAL